MSTDPEDAMRARLGEVARRYPLREIARRLEMQPSTVSRYLKGNRIPATFLSQVSTACAVNGAWLLNGEGQPWQSDVSTNVRHRTGDLLQLVEAMERISRLKLGAIAGKDAEVVRTLHDTLESHERLQQRLADQTRETLQRLLTDWQNHVRRQEREAAERLRRTTELVARLCPDDALELKRLMVQAHHEYVIGNPTHALEIQRRIFARHIAGSTSLDEAAFVEGRRLGVALHGLGRCREAWRVYRAMFALTPRARTFEVYPGVVSACATTLLSLDQPRRALRWLQRGLTVNPGEAQRKLIEGKLALTRYLMGELSFSDAAKVCAGNDESMDHLLLKGPWELDAGMVREVLLLYQRTRVESLPESLNARLARAHLLALDGKAREGVALFQNTIRHDLMAQVISPEVGFEYLAMETQIRRLGNDEAAWDTLCRAEQSRRKDKSERDLDFGWRRVHWRNVRALKQAGRPVPASWLKKASAFEARSRARGLVV